MEMDLAIDKLEKFGLDNFINVYRFDLCNQTLSQNQIAAYLQFDANQIATINSFPANFSKNEHLYDLIQRACTVRKFLEALENTGNDHVIKFVHETDLSTLAETPSSSTNPNQSQSQSRGLWVNIPEPIDSFCGRTVFLPQLHDQLKPRDDIETEVTVLSQVKIVSGLGGIGKTETARKYISQYFECYNNFIWISAENESSMRNSFLKLAEEIHIRLLNSEGKSREIQDIVKDIYNKICEGGKSNLIVFDNAEDYKSCKNFFPFALHPNLTKPVILVTSRNQEWTSEKGEITVLPLDVLTESESLEFILKKLDIEDSPQFKEESGEFIELIGGLPLALQQAVAYVKHQKKVNELLSRPYKLSDYALEFKSSMDKLQSFPLAPDSSTTVFITWNLTFEKIKGLPQGQIAIDLIQVMACLQPDKIPVGFLGHLLPLPSKWFSLMGRRFQMKGADLESTDLAQGIRLLEKFSMVKTSRSFVSIHRQVQFLIIHHLKKSGRLLQILNHMLTQCGAVLEYIKVTNIDIHDFYLNLFEIIKNHVTLTAIPEGVEAVCGFFSGLSDASFANVVELNEQALNKYLDMLKADVAAGESGSKKFLLDNLMASQLIQQREYGEALDIYTETVKQVARHPDYGKSHPLAVTLNLNMAMIFLFLRNKEESLKLFKEALLYSQPILNELQQLILHIRTRIASLFQHPQSQSQEKEKDAENNQTQILNLNHLLLNMGEFEESSKILEQVSDKIKNVLIQDHQDTRETLLLIAETLSRQQRFRDALDPTGNQNPNSKFKVGQVLTKLKELEESLRMLQEMYFQHIMMPGEDNTSTLELQFDVAVMYYEQKDFKKALQLSEHVERKQSEALGPNHPETVESRRLRALVLIKLEQYEEALQLLEEIRDQQMEILKESDESRMSRSHSALLESEFQIAFIMEKQWKLAEALQLFRKVLQEQEILLGGNHRLTIKSLKSIENLVSLMTQNGMTID